MRSAVNATHTSLLDIAPTLLAIAGIEAPAVMDGGSLLPLLDQPTDPARSVVGEYLGEGAIAPIFMIRRGTLKFVWSRPDPPQLFDLATDPCELVNLAIDDDHRQMVDDFTAEVMQRWDPDAIEQQVRANQMARATVDRAVRQGRFTAWDYIPQSEAANQYMRNHLDLNDVEAGRRA